MQWTRTQSILALVTSETCISRWWCQQGHLAEIPPHSCMHASRLLLSRPVFPQHSGDLHMKTIVGR